mmetsp:Transcript_8254/g.22034  ORF Transcript_8254/g.22034 Transcript_8254/m.22034 type:complete len:207 (+) Transcript_8254:308-928(+)
MCAVHPFITHHVACRSCNFACSVLPHSLYQGEKSTHHAQPRCAGPSCAARAAPLSTCNKSARLLLLNLPPPAPSLFTSPPSVSALLSSASMAVANSCMCASCWSKRAACSFNSTHATERACAASPSKAAVAHCSSIFKPMDSSSSSRGFEGIPLRTKRTVIHGNARAAFSVCCTWLCASATCCWPSSASWGPLVTRTRSATVTLKA